jgi:hypothetical protein
VAPVGRSGVPCVLLLAGDCPQAGIAAAAGSARISLVLT